MALPITPHGDEGYFVTPHSDAGYFVTPHSDAGSSCEPLVGNIGTYNPCVLKRGTSKETTQMRNHCPRISGFRITVRNDSLYHHSPNKRKALAVVAASTSASVTPRISAMRWAMRGRYDGSLRLPR